MSYKQVHNLDLFEAVVADDMYTEPIPTDLIDQLIIQTINLSSTPKTTISIFAEVSVDGEHWSEINMEETNTAGDKLTIFTYDWMPWRFIRIGFKNTLIAGDTFKVIYSAKGV